MQIWPPETRLASISCGWTKIATALQRDAKKISGPMFGAGETQILTSGVAFFVALRREKRAGQKFAPRPKRLYPYRKNPSVCHTVWGKSAMMLGGFGVHDFLCRKRSFKAKRRSLRPFRATTSWCLWGSWKTWTAPCACCRHCFAGQRNRRSRWFLGLAMWPNGDFGDLQLLVDNSSTTATTQHNTADQFVESSEDATLLKNWIKLMRLINWSSTIQWLILAKWKLITQQATGLHLGLIRHSIWWSISQLI